MGSYAQHNAGEPCGTLGSGRGNCPRACGHRNRLYGKHYDIGKIVCIALYHDAAEVFTGDMPTPVKYFSPEMRSGYGLIEKQAAEKLISKLPEELRDEYTSLLSPDDAECERIVKIADKLCAYIKCLTEEASGQPRISLGKAGDGGGSRQIRQPGA